MSSVELGVDQWNWAKVCGKTKKCSCPRAGEGGRGQGSTGEATLGAGQGSVRKKERYGKIWKERLMPERNSA